MSEIQKHFDETKINFYECLEAFQGHELEQGMVKLRKSLRKLEDLAEEDLKHFSNKNVALFVQMFQFELLARDEVWNHTPKLHYTIGSLIHNHHEIENEFRHNIMRSGLGRLLDFTN